MKSLTAKKFIFADFEIDATRRRLFKQGEPVALNSKTFDLLLVLVERRGEVLSKEELLDTVWAGQFVEEGNLAVHISTLRKILGEKKDDHQFIITVPGRGYSFVAELQDETKDARESEIIVESHSLSQIVVEEEITESDKPVKPVREVPALENPATKPGWLKSHRLWIAVSVLALMVALGGYLLLHQP